MYHLFLEEAKVMVVCAVIGFFDLTCGIHRLGPGGVTNFVTKDNVTKTTYSVQKILLHKLTTYSEFPCNYDSTILSKSSYDSSES